MNQLCQGPQRSKQLYRSSKLKGEYYPLLWNFQHSELFFWLYLKLNLLLLLYQKYFQSSLKLLNFVREYFCPLYLF